jgi:hypothetical protein
MGFKDPQACGAVLTHTRPSLLPRSEVFDSVVYLHDRHIATWLVTDGLAFVLQIIRTSPTVSDLHGYSSWTQFLVDGGYILGLHLEQIHYIPRPGTYRTIWLGPHW